MNFEESRALDHVLEHYLRIEAEHAQAAGDPPGHIADSLMTLDHFRQRHPLELDDAPRAEEVASRPNGELTQSAAGSPIGIVRDHPSHDEDRHIQHLIIWSLLLLAKLPDTVANLVRDAVNGDLDEQCSAALAAVDAIARLRRDPESEIPF